MASSVRPKPTKASGFSEEDCLAVLRRVSGSKLLEKSVRSRELLTFLCHFGLNHKDEPLPEQRIGETVFGREAGYDTTTDTIARVQVSQLRKKLKEYFSSEGSAEQIIIEIPPGSYLPVFRPREANHVAFAPAAVQTFLPPPRSQTSRGLYAGFAVVSFCLGASLWALIGGQFTRNSALGSGAPWDTLWRPFLGDAHYLPVVISDANLMMVSRLLGRLITLHEYRDPNYPASVIDLFADPRSREVAKTILGNYYTGVQDTRVVNDLSSVTLRYGTPVTVLPAREFRMITGVSGNVVLIGHNHGNPWFELFDGQMNFHYVWPRGAEEPLIANRHPRQGESEAYPVVFQKSGYCLVSLRPRPDRHGDALLIIGTDLSSLDAGGRFLTEPNWLRVLYSTLHLRSFSRVPYFEILLKTDLLTSTSPGFQIVASRVE